MNAPTRETIKVEWVESLGDVVQADDADALLDEVERLREELILVRMRTLDELQTKAMREENDRLRKQVMQLEIDLGVR